MATFAKQDNTLIRDEEVKSDKSLPTKRKPRLNSLDKDNIHEQIDDLNKKQKLGTSSTDESNSLVQDVEENVVNGTESHSIQADKSKEQIKEEEDEDEDDYEADEEEDDDDDNDDDDNDSDDEDSDGNAEIADRKGKGIMQDNKCKGKLMEKSEDSSDCGTESDGDSDLSDDPLAEVDLDNILPPRTRRHAVRPGVYISNNQGPKEDEDDGDDSNSYQILRCRSPI